mmetsp:Transcript_63628/g.152098  ORF Transcript_63628/g.152098 Transcript_63628/m.152098 type:complete len:1102 (-) Transcript_63628:85-3390(-)
MSSASLSNSPSTSSGRAEETEFVVEEVEVHVEEDEADDAGKSVEEEEIFDECLEKYQAVQENCLEEMRLPLDVVDAVKQAWSQFVSTQSSRDAAGEAIYAALFDSAPTLQNLFMTPRSVMALRFMNGIVCIIMASHDPAALKMEVESIGFRHLERELTASRVAVFREAIVELLDMELPNGLTSKAKMGLQAILNYAGGAFIYIRQNYLARVKVIQRSWRIANNKGAVEEEDAKSAESEQQQQQPSNSRDFLQKSLEETVSGRAEGRKDSRRSDGSKNTSATELKVPTTFNEMFLFNAAVMGFSSSGSWMHNILEQFDGIVTNVANSYRLQEECDVLSLVLARHSGSIKLSEFKAVMLASLRSLVPKEWDSNHEVAWNWLWENVERMIQVNLGKPAAQEKALSRLIASLSADDIYGLRKSIYQKFFQAAPAGQDHFKQSTTRLYFIADKIIEMTMEMYQQPRVMVEDISALGLRHVGYGIPTELFGPFVSAAIENIRMLTSDGNQEEAFRWSIGLISRVLVRTITEGSTLVMRAINANCGKMLRKAVSCAPRGERAEWMLKVQVGTQSISPLLWSIESGSLEAAGAIISDLLTIRADRDHYYYAMEALFIRHSDIVRRICQDGPELLPTLFDGLIWRSRNSQNGLRRVNYFIKYLIVDTSGSFSESFRHVVDNDDPSIACHPAVVLSADIIWSRLASFTFLLGKLWFLLNLVIFVVTQAVLSDYRGNQSSAASLCVFIGRLFIYILGLGQLLIHHLYNISKSCRARDVKFIKCIPLPSYLIHFSEALSGLLCLALVGMFCQEPILHCLGTPRDPEAPDFAELGACPEVDHLIGSYSSFAFAATLLYFLLLLELTVFSTKLSTFVLVCGRMLSEVGQFLFALFFVVVAFSCGLASSDVGNEQFSDIFPAMLSLSRIMLGMFSSEEMQALDEPKLVLSVSIFVICTTIFLLNLLIAQLNCAYLGIFKDMLGYARLNRGSIILDNVIDVSAKRWNRFTASLRMDEKLEFNEGDIGLPGGIQVSEPASAHPVTTDSIKRYGGSTSPASHWPETSNDQETEDKVDKLEKIIERAVKKITKAGGAGSKAGSTSGSGASSVSNSSAESG